MQKSVGRRFSYRPLIASRSTCQIEGFVASSFVFDELLAGFGLHPDRYGSVNWRECGDRETERKPPERAERTERRRSTGARAALSAKSPIDRPSVNPCHIWRKNE